MHLNPGTLKGLNWRQCDWDSGQPWKRSDICHATTGFAAKWRLRNERRNTILMTRHYPDIGRSTALFGYWHVISMEFLRPFLRRHFSRENQWWCYEKSAAFSLLVMLPFFSAGSLLIKKLCRKLLTYPQTRVVSQNGPRIHSQRTLTGKLKRKYDVPA